jgi:S-adenosyl methyltransferase
MDRFPPGVDGRRPNIARVYDCFLGGDDNFDADRELFSRLLAIAPDAMRAAMDNRAFLQRVVRFLVTEAGIRQFIDIGSGLPTRGNIHQAVLEAGSQACVTYIDNDPAVIAHSRILLDSSDNATMILGDARRPQQILENPEVSKLLDPGQPVALTMLGVLHHINDDEDPAGITAQLRRALPPGSYVAISHFRDVSTMLPTTAWTTATTQKILNESLGSGVWRTYEEILGYFGGFELIDPGLVPLADWRPAPSALRHQHFGYHSFIGGLARKVLAGAERT